MWLHAWSINSEGSVFSFHDLNLNLLCHKKKQLCHKDCSVIVSRDEMRFPKPLCCEDLTLLPVKTLSMCFFAAFHNTLAIADALI